MVGYVTLKWTCVTLVSHRGVDKGTRSLEQNVLFEVVNSDGLLAETCFLLPPLVGYKKSETVALKSKASSR